MATIFPLSASVGQQFQDYAFDGESWNIIGENWKPFTYSATEPDYHEPGFIWVDSNEVIEEISYVSASGYQILTNKVMDGDNNYFSNIPESATLPSQDGNSGKYLTTSGSVSSWGVLDLSLYLTQNSASNTYLTQSSASTTYATQSDLDNIDLSLYLTSASMQTVPVYVMNSGSSAQRPVSASAGMFRYNTDSNYPEWYDSSISNWLNFYQEKVVYISYLIVAGGGGGGARYNSAGGGAGGYLQGSTSINLGSSYGIVVGSGGAGGTAEGVAGTNGQNSSFFGLTSIGGGGGGSFGTAPASYGKSGGSGGGASGYAGGNFGSGTAGQGNDGGSGGSFGGGGGGGAFASGSNGSGSDGGTGGAGKAWVDGLYYSGGGGGADYSGTGANSGGIGGGGNGASGPNSGSAGNPTSGTVNTGGGGGGANGYNNTTPGILGGNGGSGVVIIQYSGNPKATGGVISTVSGITYHTFTTSGTLTL